MSSNAAEIYRDYEILHSFFEQHQIDVERTILSVSLNHIHLLCGTQMWGCRQIIGRLLNNVMRATMKRHGLSSGAVFHEHPLCHPNIPGLG